jgi:DNA-binding GntR family transcriptional regulator
MKLPIITKHKISVADMAPHIHSFSIGENKVQKLFKWMVAWIESSLSCGKISPYDMLPSKAELACHIGVSQGTVQNVYRLVEDAGYIESKQRVGTFIKDRKNNAELEKLTSKRELAIQELKKYIKNNNFKLGDVLPSTRKLTKILNISNTTLRTAILALITQEILVQRQKQFIIVKLDYEINSLYAETLVEKVANNLREYIKSNLSKGDKLPSNSILTKKLQVSSKTIHDAIKILIKEEILYSKRGRYGTIVLNGNISDMKNDLYDYEKVEGKIKHYIAFSCSVGDKIPTIKEFATKYNTSEKTVKKAIDNLVEDGYVMCTRGRYGGTFVTDIPQSGGDAYKWLAINSNYISNIEN